MNWVNLLRRTVVHWLRPGARNSLAVALLLSGHDRWPRPVTDWSHRRVLVLSPHPDDEAIGCGGSVLRHVAAGAAVTVLHMTDGRNGSRDLQDPSLPTDLRAQMVQSLRETRMTEARAWGAGAGVTEVLSLGVPDGEVGADAEVVQRLWRMLDRLQPDLIYLPALTDLLEDHWQTNLVLEAALGGRQEAWCQQLLLRSYEVWSTVPANCVIDISDVFDRKLALLRLYHSQLKDVDYCRAVEGLNTYRSMMLHQTGQGHAEAFLETSLPGWQAVMARRR